MTRPPSTTLNPAARMMGTFAIGLGLGALTSVLIVNQLGESGSSVGFTAEIINLSADGEAIILDPEGDIDDYLDDARGETTFGGVVAPTDDSLREPGDTVTGTYYREHGVVVLDSTE